MIITEYDLSGSLTPSQRPTSLPLMNSTSRTPTTIPSHGSSQVQVQVASQLPTNIAIKASPATPTVKNLQENA